MRLFASTLAFTLLWGHVAHADCPQDGERKGDPSCVGGGGAASPQGATSTRAANAGAADPTDTQPTHPHTTAPVDPEAEADSPVLFGFGVALTLTGTIALTAGSVLLAVGLDDDNAGGLIFGGAMAAGAGALLVPTGIVMIELGGDPTAETNDARVTFAPWALPSAGGVAVVGTF